MNKPTKLLFALLRSEFAGIDMPQDLCGTMEEDSAEQLYALAKQHNMENLIGELLMKQQIPLHGRTADLYKKSIRQAVFKHSVQEHELIRVGDALEQAQIPFLPLKGAVLCHYYPQPYMRSSSDVDILVPQEQVEKAVGIMTGVLQYQQQDSLSDHDYRMIAPSGAVIELHYKLMEENRLPEANGLLSAVWEHCTPVQGCRYQMQMSAPMFLFYHMAHMAKHILIGGCGVRPVLDLWLIRRNMEFDEQATTDMMREGGLDALYDTCVTLSQVWMDQKEHSGISRELEAFILEGGRFGTLSIIQTVRAVRGESKAQSWYNLLFLSRRNLQLLYPQLKEHPGLAWYYQIKRWFKVFRKDKRSTVRKITAARADVSEEDKDKVSNLFDGLGL